MNDLSVSVSEFTALFNQISENAFSGITIIGEVSEYKVNQGKWVFFKLKDEESVIDCFLSIFQLRVPIEDGMRIAVKGLPRLTKWGRLSFTVSNILPVGEGSIKKSFELLKAKLEKEGLFAPEKKRPLPDNLEKVGIISSPDAAGYADFIKITNERSGGLHFYLAKTQVQGLIAADQIIRALNYFNEHGEVQLIAIIRGGGSKDDLAVFNDENLVRAVASSRIPVITGIGHEIDTSLCDLAADIVGSTPSNVAQLITRDKNEIIRENEATLASCRDSILSNISEKLSETSYALRSASSSLKNAYDAQANRLKSLEALLDTLNPDSVLRRGYAIIRGNISPGNVVKITTYDKIIETEVKNVTDR